MGWFVGDGADGTWRSGLWVDEGWFLGIMRRSPQEENGIISALNLSGEMHMQRRNEVFGCIPHARGALT